MVGGAYLRMSVAYPLSKCRSGSAADCDGLCFCQGLKKVDPGSGIILCQSTSPYHLVSLSSADACMIDLHTSCQRCCSHSPCLAEGRLLLASASQDKYIRIWALREASTARSSSQSAAPAFARSALISGLTQSALWSCPASLQHLLTAEPSAWSLHCFSVPGEP